MKKLLSFCLWTSFSLIKHHYFFHDHVLASSDPFFAPRFFCTPWLYYNHGNLLQSKQNMYRQFIFCSHWNSRPVQRQCQMWAMYSRQNRESLQLEEWPIFRAHHSFLPCYYCSGYVGHILGDGVYSKASSPCSGWSLNFNSDTLLTLETDGCEATGVKQLLREVSWVCVMCFEKRNVKSQGDLHLFPKLKRSSILHCLFWSQSTF